MILNLQICQKRQRESARNADAANAAYTPEDVLNMTAFGNPDATYAGLVEAVQTLTY